LRAAAILLAAGGAVRFGSPKVLLRVGGRTLLSTAVEAAEGAGCRPVVVVTGAHRQEVERNLDGLAVTVVWNRGWEEGMAASIRTARAHLRSRPDPPDAVILLPCDLPALDAKLIRRLAAGFRPPDATIVACEYGGVTGIPALFGWRHVPELARLTGDVGARGVLRRQRTQLRVVPCPEAAADVDTRQDLARIRRRR